MAEEKEPEKSLWGMAFLIIEDGSHQLVFTYAVDRDDAKAQALEWAKKNRKTFLSVTHYPRGFHLAFSTIPGKPEQKETPDE